MSLKGSRYGKQGYTAGDGRIDDQVVFQPCNEGRLVLSRGIQSKLKDMGYEKFRDAFHKKLDNGNYILDAERLGLCTDGDELTYVGEINNTMRFNL